MSSFHSRPNDTITTAIHSWIDSMRSRPKLRATTPTMQAMVTVIEISSAAGSETNTKKDTTNTQHNTTTTTVGPILALRKRVIEMKRKMPNKKNATTNA